MINTQLINFHLNLSNLKDSILLVGRGMGNSIVGVSRSHLYTTITKEWQEVKGMSELKINHNMATLRDKVYCIGGAGCHYHQWKISIWCCR